MSQGYNGNTKRPKPKENQWGIFRNLCILLKASGPGEGAAGVTHLWEYTQKAALSSPEKLLLLYLVVQWRVQLERSSHIVQVGVEATY